MRTTVMSKEGGRGCPGLLNTTAAVAAVAAVAATADGFAFT